MLAEHSIYEYGHIFPLILSLVAIGVLFNNRKHLRDYRYYLQYQICCIAFFSASLLYMASVIVHIRLLHNAAGLAEMACLVAIIWMLRKDLLEGGSDA